MPAMVGTIPINYPSENKPIIRKIRLCFQLRSQMLMGMLGRAAGGAASSCVDPNICLGCVEPWDPGILKHEKSIIWDTRYIENF